MDIKFYYVNKDYVDYLKKYETDHRGFTCVPNVEYANRSKFLYGAVLCVNDINYFVPISSKIKREQYSMLIKTKDRTNPIKGTLRFRYMIPIPTECLISLNIKTMIEPERQKIVMSELAACRKNRDEIFSRAKSAYNDITKYNTSLLLKNSCDFKLLEQAYREYINERLSEKLDDIITEADKISLAVADIKAEREQEQIDQDQKDKKVK